MRALLLLPLLSLLVACPGPTTPPDASVEPPDAGEPDAGFDAGQPRPDAGPVDAGFTAAPYPSWCQLYAQAQCFRDQRCQRITAARFQECVTRRMDTCDQVAFTRATDDGRFTFDEDAGVNCLNGFAQGGCTELPADCAGVFLGQVPPDAGCVLNEECDTAGFCYQYDNVCPHHCRGWRALGEACDSFTTQCDPATAVCARDGGANVCQSRKVLDEPCVDYSSCGVGMACISSMCTLQRADAGEACGVRSGYPFCPTEYFCRQPRDSMGNLLPGTCQLRSGVGGACTGNGDCQPSLRCTNLISTGTCVPKVPVGGNCTSYDDCEDGVYCNAAQRCEPFPGDGGDCSPTGSWYRCDTGHFCSFDPVGDNDTCEARHPLGGSCSYDDQCLSKDCEFGALPDGGFGGICIPRCSERADGGF